MTMPLRDFAGDTIDPGSKPKVPATSSTPAEPSESTGGADKFSIIKFLGKVEFFQYLEPEELAAVAARLNLKTYQAGQVVFRKDEPGSTLHIIASESVKISMPTEEGEEAPLALLKPGDYFGELALLDGGLRTASATSVGVDAALSLEREDFLGFITTHPRCAAAVFRALATLIRRQNMQLFGEFFSS